MINVRTVQTSATSKALRLPLHGKRELSQNQSDVCRMRLSLGLVPPLRGIEYSIAGRNLVNVIT